MQLTSFLCSRLVLRPLVFNCLLLALLASAILFAPRSAATHQIIPVSGQENQAALGQKRQRPQFVPGEALVRFRQNRAFEGAASLPVPNADASIQSAGKSVALAQSQEQVFVNVDRFEGSGIVDGLRMARMAPDDTMKAIAALQARDDVLYAEPNYVVHVNTTTPNDPQFNSLYGLAKIGAPQAWDTTQGNRSVVVGIIDEGIDVSHPDLQANIWTNPSPGSIAGISGDVHGYDFINGSGTIPAEPHATHVAGTIGAVGNNSVGVAGVNWQVSLMSLRFIDDATGSGSDADAMKAYNYAKQMRDLWTSSGGTKGANIRALNASYGGGGYSQAEADAINALGQSGILFVAAAGNDGRNTDVQPNYPSDYALSNVVSVAATNSSDALASFSNFGTRTVLLGAPGVSILSTTPNNTYSFFSGTSMATPHVTGAAALLCAANPNLSVNQLRALLSFNGDVVSALQGQSLSGRRLNVFKSLQAMNSNDTTPPGTVANFAVTSQNGRALTVSWIASGDDAAAGQASLYDLSFTDQFTGAVIPLTTVAPVASGSPQSVTVNIPYRHTNGRITLREFDKVGNEGTPATFPVTVDRSIADPYVSSLASPAALSTGGTPLSLNCDDCFKTTSLSSLSGGGFPFFGTNFSSVTISSNGNVYFVPPTPPTRSNGDADDVPSSTADLSQFKMIAGMWDDLDLRTSRRADADVYVVQPDSSRIIFRWQGVQYGDGTHGDAINFEVELDSNGTIKTRYGSGNTNLFPVVGISGGEPDTYVASSLTSELSLISLTNAQSAVFTPRSLVALPAVQFNASIYSVNENGVDAFITVTRTGDTTSTSSVSYATSDTAGAQPCGLANGLASSRCNYITTIGALTFAAADSSKTISIPIINNSYAEGNKTFTITLSNPSGATLGSPASATITIINNRSSNGVNPIDTADFFVRQHYIDFLNREPDTSGIGFWTNNIESCGTNSICRDLQRINTSAAFFLSIEFQQTGYLVERLYKAAYGDGSGTSTVNGVHFQLAVPIVRFSEFLPDTQQIGQGLVVGQNGWETVLENNKQNFTAQFVQRSRFTTAFPTSLTPAQFVDKLNSNAGSPGLSGVLSASERTTAIALFGSATDTSNITARTQALRQVAENQNLQTAEFNRAFVLMQFFGYLRRNPNDAPDADYTGFDFWLSKLNQFNGNFVAAEMVKAFITSSEYRQRFGP